MNYRVTAVIPAHNAGRYIREALDSVASQERPPSGVVVVDDGSTDDTAQQVKRWRDERGADVQLVIQDNAGPAAARNVGIRLADTELVGLLDADDLWLPHHLRTLVDAFERSDEVVLSFGDQQEFDARGPAGETFLADKAVHRLDHEELPDGHRLLEGSVYRSLTAANYVPTSGSVFSREAAERAGLFDVSRALIAREDREFLLRLSRTGRFAHHPAVVAHKRIHEDNITHPRHNLALQEHGLEVLVKMTRSAEPLGLTEEELEATRAEADRHAESLLYHSSLQGPRAYRSALSHVLGRGLLRPALNPKHMVRALRHVRSAGRGAPG